MLKNDFRPEDLLLYEDSDYLIINKPATVLSQPDHSGDINMQEMFEAYAGHPLHLYNRLDRPASGCLLAVRSAKSRTSLKDPKTVIKKYYAIISPADIPAMGSLHHYILRDGRINKAICSENSFPGAREAKLTYRMVQELSNYRVLDIEIFTGRFHQIRAQLGFINAPIKGDVKYGARRANKDRSIDLHAYYMKLPENDIAVTAPRIPEAPIWDDSALWNNSLLPE